MDTIFIKLTLLDGITGNKLLVRYFWMAIPILVNITFMDLGDMTLLCVLAKKYE